jgi:hypothetical protein
MAAYKVIGGDQKEYGPASAEELRQWLTAGRLNAQSLVQAEGSSEWKPLASFPEFADLFAGAQPLVGSATVGTLSPDEILARDYDLDIGGCITRSWQVLREHFWPVVGISFLALLLIGAADQVIGLISKPAMDDLLREHKISVGGMVIIFATSLVSTVLSTIMMGGLMKYYLKLLRGEAATIGDAFSGFSLAAGPLALLGLVTGLLTFIGYALCLLPGVYLNVAWLFAIPLVIDRQMDFWNAMELSRKVVSKHWFVVFAFGLIAGLVASSGIVVCCVGIFVTIPLGVMSLLCAYEDIFCRQTR